MALLDPELENEANNTPGEVVERGGGRDGSRATEEERRDEIFDWGFGVSLGGIVDDDGGDGAEDEEEEEAGVDLTRGEHSSWADETPYDGCWKIMQVSLGIGTEIYGIHLIKRGGWGLMTYQNKRLFRLGR